MFRITLAALVLVPLAASAQKTEDEKNLYAIGFLVGQRSVQAMKLSKSELKIVEQGFNDGAGGAKPKVDPSQRQQQISEFARGRQEAAAAKISGPEKEEGK